MSRGAGAIRIAFALLLLAAGGALLVPGSSDLQRVSWDELIKPFGVGLQVTRGYFLSPPRRGEEHDIVYVARREAGPDGPAGRVEVHVVDRGHWPGAAETRSFGVDWEAPRPGATMVASTEDARAVTTAIYEAIARNDTGFPSVDSVPLANEPEAPLISRVLDRLAGIRGVLIGTAVALALVLLVSVPRGAIVVGLLLFALGLALRVPSLGLPFAHDQDVQRMFTGNLPLHEIATGAGLKDRHPPLYFFVLHVAQRFGQSEAVGRAPAVLAGALVGPALLVAAASLCGGAGSAAALAGLAVTISPELVARSREVSEIPLFALIVIATAASLVAALRDTRRTRLVAVVVSHALALFTYYLAPFIVAAHAAVLAWLRTPNRRVVWALVVGVVAGAPAFVLGILTLFRDWGARDVARAFPALAWGQHSPFQMAIYMSQIAVEACGPLFFVLLLVVAAVGIARRDLAVITPVLGCTATFAGIALLSPIARVQGYYVTTVLPLAVLTLAVSPEPERVGHRIGWLAALVLVVAFSTVPLLAGARSLYVPDTDAFMPRFANVIAQRPEHTVVTVAHYDKTLLAYYLALGAGRSISWSNVDDPPSKRIEPLVLVHAMHAGSETDAGRQLEQILAAGPALVIERDAFLLPAIAERLSACEQLLEAPSARLVRCTGTTNPKITESAERDFPL
jgi:hypothetical protein